MQRKLMYNFRGVYGKELTHSIAYLAGKVAGRYYNKQHSLRHSSHTSSDRSLKANGHPLGSGLPTTPLNRPKVSPAGPKIIVGNDHRFSSNSLKHYLVQGLISEGIIIRDVGLLPTSVLSYAVKKAADGGCMVTASHNPPEYNGLKFFDADGSVMKPETEDAILETVCEFEEEGFDVEDIGILTDNYGITPTLNVIQEYIQRVVERMTVPVPINVGIDCRLGTAFTIMPALLKELKCNYYPIHAQLNPYFTKQNGDYLNPEPKSTNISEISALVRYANLDMGLIFDGDSDRSVVVDNNGDYVEDDIILLLLALEYGEGKHKAITIDTSLMVENYLRERGYESEVTPVGDPFVSSALAAGRGSFGGVPNGHYIFPDFSLYSDGIYSAAVMAQIASRLESEDKKLSDRIAEFPDLHIRKGKIRFGRSRGEFLDDIAPRLKSLFEKYCPACASTADRSDIDYLETDETVIMAKNSHLKLLVRYNRWDNNFNVQSESLNSDDEALSLFEQIVAVLETPTEKAGEQGSRGAERSRGAEEQRRKVRAQE